MLNELLEGGELELRCVAYPKARALCAQLGARYDAGRACEAPLWRARKCRAGAEGLRRRATSDARGNGPSAKGSPQPALDDVGVPVLVEHQDGVCHVEVVAAPSEDEHSGHAKGSPQPAHLMRRAINGPSAADQS